MDGVYDIILGNETIGQAKVTRQGLYYRFDCQCHLPDKVLYKLVVMMDGQTEELGIVAPRFGAFGLEKKLPIKRFGKGRPVFHALPKQAPVGATFIPISPEEPFAYLSRLEEAVLTVQNGQIGISLPEKPNL